MNLCPPAPRAPGVSVAGPMCSAIVATSSLCDGERVPARHPGAAALAQASPRTPLMLDAARVPPSSSAVRLTASRRVMSLVWLIVLPVSKGGGSRQGPNSHVADRELAVVITLDSDVAAGESPVFRPLRELAGLDLGFPVGAPNLVFHHLLSVEPVLHARAARDDPRTVPLIGGLHDTGRRGVERVVGGSRRQTILSIRGVRVVEELIFRRCEVDLLELLRAAVEHASVPALVDLPLPFELEVRVLVARDDVVRRFHF